MSNLPYKSVPAMLRESAHKYAERPAISYKKQGKIITLSYAEFYMRVLMAARGLRKAGMAPGDRVAIFSENRAGWAISDLGVQAALGITVPIYATNTGEQAAYVINHSGARIVFVSTRMQYEKLIAVKDQIPNVDLVISYERFIGLRELPVYSLYQLSEVSYPLTDKEQIEIEGWIDQIRPEDLITVIYTSGTTGPPKGVMLSQSNMVFNATAGVKKLEGLEPTEVFLSFLPLSHVLERTAGYHAALLCGCHIAFAESVDKVIENILDFRPSVMVSVPRLFEKIHSRIYENVHQASRFKRWLFHRAVTRGREYMMRRFIEPQPIGFLLKLEHKILDRLVFSKIRARFGGNLRYFISGGAPLDKSINEFMWTIGIPTFEGYGLTETSPAITLNAPWHVRFGSVGTLLEETEAKLAEDGELLLKGPQIMSGYYEDPVATAEAFEDGWFKTGDIAKIDEDGYIFIVDRKKEIIVTSGGKNIAPQAVENELRLDKYISQAYVYGDRKPYLVAILTPNIDRVLEFAKTEKLPYLDTNELVSSRRTMELYKERVAEVNKHLPPYETIKKFVLLPREFSIEGGELTPTLKMKRRVIYEKYRDKIEGLYHDQSVTAPTHNGGKS